MAESADVRGTGVFARCGGIALACLAGGYFIVYTHRHIASLPELDWGIQAILAAVAALVLYALSIILGGMVWHLLLKSYGVSARWPTVHSIYRRAQIGKYIPGNVGHHIGRALLAREAGIALPITVQTMLMETAWGLAVGAGIATLAFLHKALPATVGNASVVAGGTSVFLFFIAALFLPLLMVKFIIAYLPELATKLAGGGHFQAPGIRTIAQVMILLLSSFLLFGLVLDLLARHLFGYPDSHILLLTGIFSWAWIAGYLTPGAPAGLGVREAVLLSALTPLYGAATSIGLSLSLRVVTTLGDGLVFLIALVRTKQV